MQLRTYQQKLESDIYTAWNTGAQNVIAQLHTGGGKTILFSKIIADYAGWSIAIAHRTQLVSQISVTLAAHNIRHNIIAQKDQIRQIIGIHMAKFSKSFYDPQASRVVAGVDTLIGMQSNPPAWFKRIGLVVQDEAHHVLRDNKWGLAARLFPNARGLYPTATPIRADGCGLGRHADGIADALVEGPPMRYLIEQGFLSDYRVFAPPSDLNLAKVTISAGGDYSPPKLRGAVHESHITGDVVSHYLKIAPGKLGVTFAVDVEAAKDIAYQFNLNGVPAEIITAKTPDTVRFNLMRRFENREILQLVNVDLLGEGVDVPAMEVVSMARPTNSYALYSQQFGRPLRPSPGKSHAIIIDHVGNTLRHNVPDAPRVWALDRRDRRARSTATDAIPLRTCLRCFLNFQRISRTCPYCGFYNEPADRSAPEYVDGDLLELDQETLKRLRGEINKIDSVAHPPHGVTEIVARAIVNKHHARQQSQIELRAVISQWAGFYKAAGIADGETYSRFYFLFGMDVLTAQALGATEAEKLKLKITASIDLLGNRG